MYLSFMYASSDGSGGLEAFSRWIDDPSLTVLELVPRPETGAATSLRNASIAGVAGALAGAR